jgi:anti-sigma B factor antagonist
MVINGVAVVTTPAEIDVVTAQQLRMAVPGPGSGGHATVVVDMTRTRFCDSAGLSVLVRAHRRALADGGELRLVLPAEGPAARVLAVTGLDQLIPSFGSLDRALVPAPAAAARPSRPRPAPRPAPPFGPASRPAGEVS